MSTKLPSNSTGNGKRQKNKKVKVKSALAESEVINARRALDASNTNYFADITHKKSSGTNNWAKFAKLSLQGRQPTNKFGLNKPQLQGTNVLDISESKNNCCNKSPIKITPRHSLKNNHLKQFENYIPAQSVPTKKLPKAVKPKTDLSSDLQVGHPNFKSTLTLTKHIAMDCEMVGVEIGVNKNMLARISLVNSHGDCIYDKYVKPTEPVLDYRTRVSGVRPKDLENATDFKTVQQEVADMLKGRILVGHALKNDLKVLYLSHPRHSIRDTSKFKKFREGKTPALRKLAKKYLGVTIQDGEHSSVQDALAAMQLYKMFKKEWESGIHAKKCHVKKFSKDQLCQSSLSKSFEI